MDALEIIAAAAARRGRKIVLPEGGDARVVQAAARVVERGLADIILLGDAGEIANLANASGSAADDTTANDSAAASGGTNATAAASNGADSATRITLAGIDIIDPRRNPRADAHAEILLRARAAKGLTRAAALEEIRRPLTLAACMVAGGDADGCVAGAAHVSADVVRAALQIVGAQDGDSGSDSAASTGSDSAASTGSESAASTGPDSAASTGPDSAAAVAAPNAAPDIPRGLVSSFFLMQHDLPHQALRGAAVFADCALVIQPDAAQLARIAVDTADSAARLLGLKPRVALLSFSTAGSARHALVDKVRRAGELAAAMRPDFEWLPEVQFDAAVVPGILRAKAPKIAANVGEKPANVFIFPDLQSANIGYKIAERIGGARAVGPILQGLRRPVNDLSRGCSVDDIVNLVAVTAVQAAG